MGLKSEICYQLVPLGTNFGGGWVFFGLYQLPPSGRHMFQPDSACPPNVLVQVYSCQEYCVLIGYCILQHNNTVFWLVGVFSVTRIMCSDWLVYTIINYRIQSYLYYTRQSGVPDFWAKTVYNRGPHIQWNFKCRTSQYPDQIIADTVNFRHFAKVPEFNCKIVTRYRNFLLIRPRPKGAEFNPKPEFIVLDAGTNRCNTELRNWISSSVECMWMYSVYLVSIFKQRYLCD